MPRTELDNWTEELSREFPTLSKPQAKVLALYSYGMTVTMRCGLSVITAFLALWLGQSDTNIHQRLREWNYEARKKRGKNRQEIDVKAHFAPLLGWILKFWQDKRLVLALDATHIKDRYIVLTVSVMCQGCGIPVAWQVRSAHEKGKWNPIWSALLSQLKPAIPPTFEVDVLTDKGLMSQELFQAIVAQNWHPFMRLTPNGFYRKVRGKTFFELKRVAFRGMKPQVMRVYCYKDNPILCTLVVVWEAQYEQPCLLVTDFPPKQVQYNPYPLRMWIEASFKDLKSGGLRWEHSKIQSPPRMERLLFVMAVANFYLIRTGLMASTQPFWHKTRSSLSVFTLGWLLQLVHSRPPSPCPFVSFPVYPLCPLNTSP